MCFCRHWLVYQSQGQCHVLEPHCMGMLPSCPNGTSLLFPQILLSPTLNFVFSKL